MREGAHPGEVVLLPGFMQGAASWSGVVERIGRRYRVRAPDHRAATFEGRLGEIAQASGRGAVLVGYSLGGRLALHAALRAASSAAPASPAAAEPPTSGASPARYTALVVLGASAGIEDDAARAERRAADERLAAWIGAASIDEVVSHWEGIPALAGQSPELLAVQRPDRLRQDPAALAELLRTAGQGVLEPVWDRLAELRLPVLALAGERDAAYVAAAQRLARLAPNARAAVIPDAGHAAHLEQPDAFAALLGEFLDEHLGERRVVDRDPEAGALGNGL